MRSRHLEITQHDMTCMLRWHDKMTNEIYNKYIMLCRISTGLGKTGNRQNFRQYRNSMVEITWNVFWDVMTRRGMISYDAKWHDKCIKDDNGRRCVPMSWWHDVLIVWFHHSLIVWCHGCIMLWLHDVMIEWYIDWTIPWFHDVMIAWFHDCMISCYIDCMMSWLHDSMMSWMLDGMLRCIHKGMIAGRTA